MGDQTRNPNTNSLPAEQQALQDKQMPQNQGRWPDGTQATDAGPTQVREGAESGAVGAGLQDSDKEAPIGTRQR